MTREPLDGEAAVEWKAEEVYLVEMITEAEAADMFDELWAKAERNAMTQEERIEATEAESDDNQDAVAELGDIVADQEAAIVELGDLIAGLGGE